MLEKTQWILDIHNTFTDKNLKDISFNNKLLYKNLLPKLIRGRTWFGLNYNWPNPNQRNSIPQNQDTYVFSWHLENVDWDFLDNFCVTHPNQQIISINEFDNSRRHPNLLTLKYHCWAEIIPTMLKRYGINHAFTSKRSHLLSCLINKPSLFKTLVASHVFQKYKTRQDLIITWNVAKENYSCPSMNFIDDLVNIPRLATLVEYYHEYLKNQSFKFDNINGQKVLWEWWDFSIPCYDVWLNLTNETFAPANNCFPGPYFSEKTWKPLLAGAAFIPIGMPCIYHVLEKFGFDMDWPWDKKFDFEHKDLNRLIMALDVIDCVLEKDSKQIITELHDRCRYNYEYIRSIKFVNRINDINQSSIDDFFANY